MFIDPAAICPFLIFTQVVASGVYRHSGSERVTQSGSWQFCVTWPRSARADTPGLSPRFDLDFPGSLSRGVSVWRRRAARQAFAVIYTTGATPPTTGPPLCGAGPQR